jgi:ribonuclease PH
VSPSSSRSHGRAADELRPVSIQTDFLSEPAGSALIEWGKTKVLCTASVQDKVPPFLQGRGSGWLTAEYAMLPGSTDSRKSRGIDGRAREIGRLVGRSLRAAVNMGELGERTVTLDCDVLQAHGGTRTASVTGAWVALAVALGKLVSRGETGPKSMACQVAGVSVGLLHGVPLLDLDQGEDREAEADMNIVMNSGGRFIEIQGTAEEGDFGRTELDEMLGLARSGLDSLFEIQTEAVERASKRA